jgi:hypothetical protein
MIETHVMNAYLPWLSRVVLLFWLSFVNGRWLTFLFAAGFSLILGNSQWKNWFTFGSLKQMRQLGYILVAAYTCRVSVSAVI